MWRQTLVQKDEEMKLKELANQEDPSLTQDLQDRKFRIDAKNLMQETKKKWNRFQCVFYTLLVISIVNDCVNCFMLLSITSDNGRFIELVI